jgi:Tfp pilus assembly protein PilN
MRELEFLPDWYPQWHRRRRLLLLETWLVIVLAAGLGLWVYLASGNLSRERQALTDINGQLSETNTQLEKIDRLESLRKQWRKQDEVLGRLGIHVEAARLMEKLAAAMPREVALVGMNFETEESTAPQGPVARSTGKDPASPALDRRLKIRLQGVAPTDVELATFLTELNKVPFFEKVAPTYSRDRREAGHILREFELTFSVNLNLPAGS